MVLVNTMSEVLKTFALAGVTAGSLAFAGLARDQEAPQPQFPGEASTFGLHVDSNKIRNINGQDVQMHGANFSSTARDCLHPEWGVFHEGPSSDQQLVILFKSWNINAVRLMLNQDCWLGLNNAPLNKLDYQKDIKNLVDLLTQNNIAVDLVLTFVKPADPDGSFIAGPAGTGGTQLPMPTTDSPVFWESVANMFKDNGSVLFDLYNEPTPDNDNATGSNGSTDAAWDTWRNGGDIPYNKTYKVYRSSGMQELDESVRKTGARNIVILSGVIWGSDISKYEDYAIDDPTGQVALGKHLYNDGLACQGVKCFKNILVPLMQKYPLLLTEFAQLDCKHDFIDMVMNFFDDSEHQASYFAHDMTPGSCDAGPALISDWSGSPTPGYGQGYHDHLINLPKPAPQPDKPMSVWDVTPIDDKNAHVVWKPSSSLQVRKD